MPIKTAYNYRKLYERFVYGSTFYTKDLEVYAKAYLSLMPKTVKTLIVCSSSGCALAAAIIALSKKDLKMIYVNKPNEKSHRGVDYAGELGDRDFCFVDDEIDTGSTLELCLDFTRETMGEKIKYVIILNNCKCYNSIKAKKFSKIKIIEFSKI